MATSLTRVKGDVKANTIFDLTFDACQKCRKSNFSSRAKGKREAKLIVNSEKKEIMVYKAKEQILRAKFLSMDTGIRMGLVRISQQ